MQGVSIAVWHTNQCPLCFHRHLSAQCIRLYRAWPPNSWLCTHSLHISRGDAAMALPQCHFGYYHCDCTYPTGSFCKLPMLSPGSLKIQEVSPFFPVLAVLPGHRRLLTLRWFLVVALACLAHHVRWVASSMTSSGTQFPYGIEPQVRHAVLASLTLVP